MISSSSHHRRRRYLVAPELRFDAAYSQDLSHLKHDDDHAIHSPMSHSYERPPLFANSVTNLNLNTHTHIPFVALRGDAPHLQSRAHALFRRCSDLSKHLGHLEAVVEILRSTAYTHLTDGQIKDVRAETDLVYRAVFDLEKGMLEVGGILDEIEAQRKEARVARGPGDWEKERGRRRGDGGW